MGENIFDLEQYSYQISKDLIAQQPLSPRDSCRLLAINRKELSIKEGIFKDIVNFFKQGDVLVLNNTKVIKARLLGRKVNGAKLEVLLLRESLEGVWEVLVKPGKRARLGDKIIFEKGELEAEIIDRTHQGGRLLKFYSKDLKNSLEKIGKIPLPPYIKREVDDPGDYQTVYAKKRGAVAAPTAGLHFTKQLFRQLKHKGIKIVNITLYCGLATFRPVKTVDIRNHQMDSERIEISLQACQVINSAKKNGRRIIAVGTTVVRALESIALVNKEGIGQIKPFSGQTRLYIFPGYRFKIIDNLITNFHTPCSTNFILVASFCGLKLLKRSYLLAKERNFRFYSFGDAMLIT